MSGDESVGCGTTVRVASTAGFGTTWTRPGSRLNDEMRSAATGWEIAMAASARR